MAHSTYKQSFSLAPIERGFLGRLIGTRGANIKALKEESGVVSLKWVRESSQFVIVGRVGAVTKAKSLLRAKIDEFVEKQDSFRSKPNSRPIQLRSQSSFVVAKKPIPPSKPKNRFSDLEGLEEKLRAEEAEAARIAREDAELDAAWAGMVKSKPIQKKEKSVVDAELAFTCSQQKTKKPKKTKTKSKKGAVRIELFQEGPSQFFLDSQERNDEAWETYKVERAQQQAAWEERQQKRKAKAAKAEQDRQSQLSKVRAIGRN